MALLPLHRAPAAAITHHPHPAPIRLCPQLASDLASACRSTVSCSYSRHGGSGQSGGQAFVEDAEQQQRAYRPPPPPPPPKPRRSGSSSSSEDSFYTLKMVLSGAALSLAWGTFVHFQLPDIQTDEYGVRYVTSAAGSKVVVGEDNRKRMYFMDAGNNLYYDSGNPEVGWFQVTDNDEVFNIFMPDTGHPDKIKSKYLGSLNDLETVKVDAVAGIPFREMRREAHGRYNGTLTFFKDQGPALPLPPNAGVEKDAEGRLSGPPVMDEVKIYPAGEAERAAKEAQQIVLPKSEKSQKVLSALRQAAASRAAQVPAEADAYKAYKADGQ